MVVVMIVVTAIMIVIMIVRAIDHAVVTIPPLGACAVAMLVFDHASGHEAQSRDGDKEFHAINVARVSLRQRVPTSTFTLGIIRGHHRARDTA
jgi:hypothetical protein